MATNGRRRTKGAGSIIHRKDGSWEFRREVGRDPATGKRRYVSAKGVFRQVGVSCLVMYFFRV